MRYIVAVNGDTRWRADVIGTKAFNLQKLILLGMKVPSCSVVTIEAFREFFNKGISGQLLDEMTEEFSKWDGTLIARSSSVAEDTAASSRAGVFTTIADVNSLPGLFEAVEGVWRSSGGEDMAVILQEQLSPDIAGVMFTRDPVTGEGEKVIEYVQGMGEALVSGRKNPKRTGGNDERFRKLVDIGEKLEDFFGYPLDIEWARTGKVFHVLQARPITALPVPQKEAGPTYSMVMAEQFFSGPVTPLFYSLFKFLYEGYYVGETLYEGGLDAATGEPLLIRHKDHMYVSTRWTEYALDRAVGSANFQQQLKVLPEDIRKEYECPGRRKTGGALGLLLRLFALLLRKPQLSIARVDRLFVRKTVPAILSGLGTLHEKKTGRKEIEQQYRKLIELQIRHIRASKWGMGYCILLTSLMQRFLERNHVKDPGARLLSLMSGLPKNRTMEGIEELRILSRKFKGDGDVRRILKKDRRTYRGYRKELAGMEKGVRFIEGFESILSRFGHRRLARDFIAPSWSDKPMIPFIMLKNMMLDTGGKDTPAATTHGARERRRTQREILKLIPVYKRSMFEFLSRHLIRYVAFRELQRFYLDMILSRMRSLFLVMGDEMLKEGVIENRDVIFFLEMDEVEDYLKTGKSDLRTVAALRRLTFRESEDKPGLYLRNGVDFDSIHPSSEVQGEGRTIKGESVSGGSFRGKIRVIENIDSCSKISAGEVLVTRGIDPGQTQAFSLAGALILEVGGVLSHGAILAREFGIPTVAQVNRATERFSDGDEVVVNGTKGEVVIMGSGNDA